MTPHKYLTLFLIISALHSCKRECKVVKQTFSNGRPKETLIYPKCGDTSLYKRQYHYNSGQLESEGWVINGEKDGEYKSWFSNGKQSANWQIKNGKEDGFIQCWYENGNKKKEVTLENGIENGISKYWFENGKLQSNGQYIDGKQNGVWTYLQLNGAWTLRTYKNGRLNGLTKEHLIDSLEGIKIVAGQFQDGKETGVWKWFDEDSILYQTATYVDGTYLGEYKRFYKNGLVELSGFLKGENTRDGEFLYYDTMGKLSKKEYWKEGKQLHK